MMKNATLLKVWACVAVTLLASSGWGFETDKNSLIKGNLTVQDTTTLGNDSSDATIVKGKLTAESDLTVQGTTTLGNGGITVKGALAAQSDLTVQGTTTLTGTTQNLGNLTVQGSTTLGNDSSDATTVKGTLTAESDLTVKQDLYVSGEVKGNAQTASALTSSGETNLLLKAYPVGAIYISTESDDPNLLFGGTWVAFGAGRVLVGFDSLDSDFDSSEDTGGEKTNSTSITVNSNGWGKEQSGGALEEPTTEGVLITGSGKSEAGENLESLAHASVNKTFTGTASTLQPYIVVYMFKRTE